MLGDRGHALKHAVAVGGLAARTPQLIRLIRPQRQHVRPRGFGRFRPQLKERPRRVDPHVTPLEIEQLLPAETGAEKESISPGVFRRHDVEKRLQLVRRQSPAGAANVPAFLYLVNRCDGIRRHAAPLDRPFAERPDGDEVLILTSSTENTPAVLPNGDRLSPLAKGIGGDVAKQLPTARLCQLLHQLFAVVDVNTVAIACLQIRDVVGDVELKRSGAVNLVRVDEPPLAASECPLQLGRELLRRELIGESFDPMDLAGVVAIADLPDLIAFF